MVYMLARATGWAEEKIHDMPYPKFLQFLHCHLVYQGAATRWEYLTEAEKAETDSKFDAFFTNLTTCH
jgi:hypothetical protein